MLNQSLFSIVKHLVAEQGESVLSEPKRVNAFFADLARNIPKPQKNAFVRSLEHGFVQVLKNADEAERDDCKQKLAQKLHDEEGYDPELCGETIELLSELLFAEEEKKAANLCNHCGKELQDEWKICPFCSTPVEAEKRYCKNCKAELQDEWKICPYCGSNTETADTSAEVMGSWEGHDIQSETTDTSAEATSSKEVTKTEEVQEAQAETYNTFVEAATYGVSDTKPAEPKAESSDDKKEETLKKKTPKEETPPKVPPCQGCSLNDGTNCKYYGCPISEAEHYDCGMRGSAELQKKGKSALGGWGTFLVYAGIGISFIPGAIMVSPIIAGFGALLWIIDKGRKASRRKKAKRL